MISLPIRFHHLATHRLLPRFLPGYPLPVVFRMFSYLASPIPCDFLSITRVNGADLCAFTLSWLNYLKSITHTRLPSNGA